MAERRLALLQMAREPVPGEVKTRLQPPLSPADAATLHARMTAHVCNTLVRSGLGEVQIWVHGNANAPLFHECLEMGASKVRVQKGGDLGARMAYALRAALAECDAAILVGSDCPAMDGDYLQAAACSLGRQELVIGPACDGGYVLIGMRRHRDALFRRVDWGSDRVLEQTLGQVSELGLDYALLEALPDIDRPEDLRLLPEALCPRAVGP